ncbi:YhgE/Pip domain-containing protein [Neobacillus terrae]|uniref:YhgE/Pip domain-containing protein n=1 Tax=Neobacillus terrae TaxID=3034837 RepID=UPI00140C3981|nr:YhgE/Pip domain-containing protein [Neobacillus terrae]NHM30992.1 YhgE/Pip domain-containing protein [Neobacillus terrae]
MLDFSWIVSEWKSLVKDPKKLIPLIGILFIPILYSGTYLWAFWDPYAHTQRLPVAVVNEDKPVQYNGKDYSLGNDLVNELKKEKSFEWKFVSKSQANKGIRNNSYYFSILIPNDFSKRATTLTQGHPSPLNLYYRSNVGTNYIASRIGEAGVDKIRERLSETISENYARAMLEEVYTIGQGLQKAANASDQISNGLAEVNAGTLKLKNEMGNKSGSIQQLSNGANKLSHAAASLADGANVLQSSMNDVSKGINSLENAPGDVQKNTTQLRQNAGTLSTVLQSYAAAHPELNNDAAFQQILGSSQNVNGGIQQLETSFGSMSNQNISTLRDGAQTINSKMNDLSSGASKIASSQKTIADGTASLASGWNRSVSSLGTISNSQKKLLKGSKQLGDQLNSGAKNIEAMQSGQPLSKMMANPVRLKEELLHDVPNYGTGLAPYFISISLFAGALLLSTVFPFRDTIAPPPSGLSWFVSKFAVLFVISIGHSLITNFLLVQLVGLKPLHLGHLYLFSFFTSLVFMALIQFLVTAGDNAGRFICIIMLVLQLTSSAGTFPVELLPTALQRLNYVLPMTYTVQGFRTVISTGNDQILYQDVLRLLAFLVVSILLTLLALSIHKRRLKI